MPHQTVCVGLAAPGKVRAGNEMPGAGCGTNAADSCATIVLKVAAGDIRKLTDIRLGDLLIAGPSCRDRIFLNNRLAI
jgi:hypothetical protein